MGNNPLLGVQRRGGINFAAASCGCAIPERDDAPSAPPVAKAPPAKPPLVLVQPPPVVEAPPTATPMNPVAPRELPPPAEVPPVVIAKPEGPPEGTVMLARPNDPPAEDIMPKIVRQADPTYAPRIMLAPSPGGFKPADMASVIDFQAASTSNVVPKSAGGIEGSDDKPKPHPGTVWSYPDAMRVYSVLSAEDKRRIAARMTGVSESVEGDALFAGLVQKAWSDRTARTTSPLAALNRSRPAGFVPVGGLVRPGGANPAPQATYDAAATSAACSAINPPGTWVDGIGPDGRGVCSPPAASGTDGEGKPITAAQTSAIDWLSGIGGVANAALATTLTFVQRQEAVDLQREQARLNQELALARLQATTNPAAQSTVDSLNAQIATITAQARDLIASAAGKTPVWVWLLGGLGGVGLLVLLLALVMRPRR